MQTRRITCVLVLLLLSSCSPRDFLNRRLATDLLLASDAFKTQQRFVLRTGVVPGKDYPSPESLVLQHHGWISSTPTGCPAGMLPPPCWNILLTASGVETVRTTLSAEEISKPIINIPVAKKELIAVTGIVREGNSADVEFTWRWVPLNEIGGALYSGDIHYRSTVGLRQYDDGWRIVQSIPHPGQTLDDAFKNAEPTS